MLTRLLCSTSLGITLLASPVAMAWERPSAEYSAQETTTITGMQMQSTLYASPKAERREMQQAGMTITSIMRFDKNVAWTLMPQQRMYTEMSLAAAKADTDLSNFNVQKTPVGKETVNGVETEKSNVVMSKADGSRMNGTMWTTPQGIVVKMNAQATAGDQSTTINVELRNLAIGKQDPGLFEIPAGYTKLDMPLPGAGMPADMGNMLKGLMPR